MDIKLIPHTARHVRSGKTVDFKQSFVEVDGQRVAIVGDAEGSRVQFTKAVSQMYRDEVVAKVGELLNKKMESTQPVELTPEQLQRVNQIINQENGDFDEDLDD